MDSATQLKQITSEIFVGRTSELEHFEQILTSPAPVKILNIHTNGDGGVGKTQLLLRMQAHCRERLALRVFLAEKLIDFYDTRSRTKVGVIQQIAENVGIEHFPGFQQLSAHYQEGHLDALEREQLLTKLQEVFSKEYKNFARTIANQNKIIVLFFDTYEFIQGSQALQNTERTVFAEWIERHICPHIVTNTCLVVSGRYPLTAVDTTTLSVKTWNLQQFSQEDTKLFWKRCFNFTSDEELVQKFGSETLINIFYTLAGGRPIFLALFVDWMNYTRNPLTPRQLFDKIAQREPLAGDGITAKHKKLFETILVDWVGELQAPEDIAVTYLAVAYRRMTPHMFQALTEVPLEQCQEILLTKLKPLSFIKYKEGNIVLLHDEMRRLIVKYWWDAHDPAKESRQDIARRLVKYYEGSLLQEPKLSETDQEIYASELLEYAFLADAQTGMERFGDEFDIAMEDGRYDYADLLLREAEKYYRENPHDIAFPDHLEIILRRVRYTAEIERNFEESLKIVNTILEKHADNDTWNHSVLRGHFLMERGKIEFAFEDFENAVHSFEKAHDVFFYEAADDVWLHWAHNWIGYTYYRQARFAEAGTYLNQSRDGFYRIFTQAHDLLERKLRRVLQGIQSALGNLTAVYNYTGQSDQAIQNAEIVLDIVRRLPRNDLEVARARATTGRAFVYAGRAIDARHHFVEAETLLQNVKNRAIRGRIKKDLGILQYRIAELSHILEYYRAEDLEKIIEKRYVSDEDIENARMFIEDAIQALGEKPAIKKELADAYYALGELYMVAPSSTNHWRQSEQAFLKSLELGKESKFQYIVADTLESLVTLYYFWNGVSGVAPDVKTDNWKKTKQHQQEFEKFDETEYPGLFGKYHITLGDIKFDDALEMFHSERPENTEVAMTTMKTAFRHYVKAAALMEAFNNQDLYYLTLQVFYNRLNVFIDDQLKLTNISKVVEQLDELSFLWEQRSEIKSALRTHFRCQKLHKYVLLRIQQENLENGIHALRQDLQDVLNQRGNFGWALLLADCLIRAYTAMLATSSEQDEYQQQLILQLKEASGYYRVLGDEYRAEQYIRAAREELGKLSDASLREGLKACIDVSEGTLKYRTGEYNQELLFYLNDELDTARSKFDQQFPGAREEAFGLLQTSEKTLEMAISILKQRLPETDNEKERVHIKEVLQIYQGHVAETKFRIGELLVFHEKFAEREYQQSLNYLQEAITYSEESGDHYRLNSAMTGYINALYFAGKYDHPDFRDQRKKYEQELGASVHPPIMGKLRIVQADALFSQNFERMPDETKGYKYVARGGKADIRTLRTMLRYYVEACNYMAQHSPIYFAAVVRVLQRRIELLSDSFALQEILHSLPHIWADQQHLKEKVEEREALSQFAKIRSIMLAYENN